MVQDSHTAACAAFEQELILYYYGELGVEERSRVESHVAACEPCRVYLSEMASLLPMTIAEDEPPQAFWDDYSREMRRKLAAARETRSGWQKAIAWLQPRRVPVFAAGAVFALALTLTLGKEIWRRPDAPPDDEAMMEAVSITENLDFFSNMEVLDAMELLEYIGANGPV